MFCSYEWPREEAWFLNALSITCEEKSNTKDDDKKLKVIGKAKIRSKECESQDDDLRATKTR